MFIFKIKIKKIHIFIMDIGDSSVYFELCMILKRL